MVFSYLPVIRLLSKDITNVSVGRIMVLRLVTQKKPSFFKENVAKFEDIIRSGPRRRKSTYTEVDPTMESYDVLLNLAMIDVEEDHYTFVQSLVWMLDTCGYLREIAADPNNESEVQ